MYGYTYKYTIGPTSWRFIFVLVPAMKASAFVTLNMYTLNKTSSGGSRHHSKGGNPENNKCVNLKLYSAL